MKDCLVESDTNLLKRNIEQVGWNDNSSESGKRVKPLSELVESTAATSTPVCLILDDDFRMKASFPSRHQSAGEEQRDRLEN